MPKDKPTRRSLDDMLLDRSLWVPGRWSDTKKMPWLLEARRHLVRAARALGMTDWKVSVLEASDDLPGRVSLLGCPVHLQVAISPRVLGPLRVVVFAKRVRAVDDYRGEPGYPVEFLTAADLADPERFAAEVRRRLILGRVPEPASAPAVPPPVPREDCADVAETITEAGSPHQSPRQLDLFAA